MPKRRVTTPKQKAASRKNLAKARAAKKSAVKGWSASELSEKRKRPEVLAIARYNNNRSPVKGNTGKNVDVFHRTNPTAAQAITKSLKWKSGKGGTGVLPGRTWFTKGSPKSNSRSYGDALLAVRVPRKTIRRESGSTDGALHVSVANKDLNGRKVRRLR